MCPCVCLCAYMSVRVCVHAHVHMCVSLALRSEPSRLEVGTVPSSRAPRSAHQTRFLPAAQATDRAPLVPFSGGMSRALASPPSRAVLPCPRLSPRRMRLPCLSLHAASLPPHCGWLQHFCSPNAVTSPSPPETRTCRLPPARKTPTTGTCACLPLGSLQVSAEIRFYQEAPPTPPEPSPAREGGGPAFGVPVTSLLTARGLWAGARVPSACGVCVPGPQY